MVTLRITLFSSLILSLFVFSFSASAQRPKTISVDEIRPGMKGYGLTVFRGTVPQRFEVEVIDVLHNFRPDQDLILVRTTHKVLEHALVVGGMSGSPIYFDGRLAGAYAYGWGFGKDPIAGVTPIRNMLSEMKRPVQTPGLKYRLEGTKAKASRRAHKVDISRDYKKPLTQWAKAQPKLPLGVQRAQTPIMLAGFTDDVAALMKEELGPLGLNAMQAAGSSRNKDLPNADRFVDGGSVGVQLIRGDMSATAIGTVTHVGKNRMIGFGHPMMNAGEIGLPTSTAKVLHILASQARSFKIAEAIQPLGTMIHDRQSAIVVDMKKKAPVIPMQLTIDGVRGLDKKKWNIELASHRLLTPFFALAGLANIIKATASDKDDVMLDVNSSVQIDGHKTLEFVDRAYSHGGVADPKLLGRMRVFAALRAILDNPFERGKVKSINIGVSMRFAREGLEIEDILIAATEVEAGTKLPIRVAFRRFEQDTVFRSFNIDIPKRLAGKSVSIEVTPGYAVPIEQPIARSLGDIVEMMRKSYASDALVFSIRERGAGLRFPGHITSNLPESAMNAMRVVTGSRPARPFTSFHRKAFHLPEIALGKAQVMVQVAAKRAH